MRLDDVTVCVAVRNAADAVSLTCESLLHHHPGARLHIRDDGSTDGAGERVKHLAQSYIRHVTPIDHGPTLDAMANDVETSLLLTLDSDVEFLSPVIGDMVAAVECGAFCVAPRQLPRGAADHHGIALSGHPRIEPFCTLFRTSELKRLLQWFSFSVQIDMGRRFYLDTAASIWQASNAAGLMIVECDWIWERILHFGGLSTSASDPSHPRQISASARLASLRAGQQTSEGLAWNGHWWQI